MNSSRSLQAESVICVVITLRLILQMCVRILQKLYTKRTKHTQTCGEKKILFGRNILEHIISMGLPLVPPPSALTGGSSVRGTAGPIWVRKGFNCF